MYLTRKTLTSLWQNLMNTSFYHSIGLLCGIWFHSPLFSSRNPLLFSIFHDTIIFLSSALSSWSFEPTYPVVSPLEYLLKHCKFSASEIKCVIKFPQRMVLRMEEGFLSVALRLGREANGQGLERFWSSRYYYSKVKWRCRNLDVEWGPKLEETAMKVGRLKEKELLSGWREAA